MVKLQVYEDNAGEWRWKLVAENGRIIADSSEGYSREADCRRAIDTVVAAFANGHTVETRRAV